MRIRFFPFQKSSYCDRNGNGLGIDAIVARFYWFACWRNSMELERERGGGGEGRSLNQREINFFFAVWFWSWNNPCCYINLFTKNDIKKIWGDYLTNVNFNFTRQEEWKPLLTFVRLNLYVLRGSQIFSEIISC